MIIFLIFLIPSILELIPPFSLLKINPDFITFCYIIILSFNNKKNRYISYLFASFFQELLGIRMFGIYFLLYGLILFIYIKFFRFFKPNLFSIIFLLFLSLFIFEFFRELLFSGNFNIVILGNILMQFLYFSIILALFLPKFKKYVEKMAF